MRNKYITFICLIFILCLCCSCNNKENIRINTVDKKKQDVISEDITIDKAYLNKRYPNKTVLTWVYHEKEYMSDKERELYKHPLGMRYLTNRQIISLNDNLNKQGKSYVVCFKKLNGGKKFAKEIKDSQVIVDMIILKSFIFYSDEIKKDEKLINAYEDILLALTEIRNEKAAVLLDEFRIH